MTPLNQSSMGSRMRNSTIGMLALAAIGLACACGGSSTTDADLGKACSGATCSEGLTCGASGEQAGQCVVEVCPTAGPGPDHGCPDNGFCYVFDKDDGHYCARICQVDADCAAVNPSLVCKEQSSTEASSTKICVSH